MLRDREGYPFLAWAGPFYPLLLFFLFVLHPMLSAAYLRAEII
jgi:hypothetical protein